MFRESGVVHSFEVVDPVLFVFECQVLYSSSCLMFSLLILSILVYPVTVLRKRISAACLGKRTSICYSTKLIYAIINPVLYSLFIYFQI